MTFLAKHSSLLRAVALTVVGIAGVAAILGSETVNVGTPSEYFTMNYEIRAEPDPSTILADVSSGATSVASYMTPSRCEFDLDVTSANTISPVYNFNGRLGQSGANLAITGTNLTPNSPPTSACRTLSDINILIGDNNTVLNAGVPVTVSSASLIANGPGLPADATFSTSSGFFSGEVTSRNSNTGYFLGEFNFIGIGPGGFVIFMSGTYGSP